MRNYNVALPRPRPLRQQIQPLAAVSQRHPVRAKRFDLGLRHRPHGQRHGGRARRCQELSRRRVMGRRRRTLSAPDRCGQLGVCNRGMVSSCLQCVPLGAGGGLRLGQPGHPGLEACLSAACATATRPPRPTRALTSHCRQQGRHKRTTVPPSAPNVTAPRGSPDANHTERGLIGAPIDNYTGTLPPARFHGEGLAGPADVTRVQPPHGGAAPSPRPPTFHEQLNAAPRSGVRNMASVPGSKYGNSAPVADKASPQTGLILACPDLTG